MTDIDRSHPASATRALVWTLLGLCGAGNLALSVYGGPLVAHLAVGVAAVVCIAVLAVSYLRGRR